MMIERGVSASTTVLNIYCFAKVFLIVKANAKLLCATFKFVRNVSELTAALLG
jgi:hypothetical protein